MHLRCPHCQNPIELADLPTGGEVTCIGCGSSFQLANFSTVTWDNQTTKRIGKFEILATVGHGAFGTVVKAHDTELDRIVAIKIPRASNVGPDPQDLDRFLREARSVAQLRFPSIITIHEVGIHDALPYLVCDFVEGITLADLLTGRRPTFQDSAKLIAEVADALQYAHSLGVVHRDVKPSNIMIRPDGTPCVMDFGLAKRDAGEITMTIDGQILGTPAYMSPEQARGEGHRVDGRSDVYSLGVILYQLLTGELPFRGNKAMLLHQVLHEEPRGPRTLNDKIPRDLETIALKAMAKEPGRRYGSAKEMADDLRRWLAGEPILARPVGAVERAWRWCRRKPTYAAFVVMSLILTISLTAIGVWYIQERSKRAAQGAALAKGYHELGTLLSQKNRDSWEAELCFRQAIESDPNDAESHFALGRHLLFRGEVDEAQAKLRLAAHLTPKGHYLVPVIATSLKDCDERKLLEFELTDILDGKRTQTVFEYTTLAERCIRLRVRSYKIAKLYQSAFAAAPAGTEQSIVAYRYQAARAAANAGTGAERREGELTQEEAARLRELAFKWMLDELDFHRKTLTTADAETTITTEDQLSRWFKDGALDGIRDAKELFRLEKKEYEMWAKFWADVAATMEIARNRFHETIISGVIDLDQKTLYEGKLTGGTTYYIAGTLLHARKITIETNAGESVPRHLSNVGFGWETFTPDADGTYRLVAHSVQSIQPVQFSDDRGRIFIADRGPYFMVVREFKWAR